MWKSLPLSVSLALTSCVFQNKDDVLPIPVVSTPFVQQGSVGIINEVARIVKRVEIFVEIIERRECLSSYSHNQLRFELVKPGETQSTLIKVIEPVKRNLQFIERLEDSQQYTARLIFVPNEKVLSSQKFHATQDDKRIQLEVPCRDHAAS